MSILIKDGAGSNVTLKSTTDTGQEVPHHIIDGTVTVNTGLTQPLTDAQLRNSPVPVSLASQPLPTGAATQATLENVSINQGAQADAAASSDTGTFSLIALIKRLLTKLPGLGQQTMSNSQPVVIASNQTDVPNRINAYNYPISVGNSSTSQLTAGATFTGTIESPQDLPSISILLTSDQPITLIVRQYIDIGGIREVSPIVFYVRANEGFSRSFAINGNFVRVDATNTGASTTTTFNLNVAYGTLNDADSSGAQPVTELPTVLIGQPTQTATVNNILTPTSGSAGLNVSSLRSASVQVISTGIGGTFIFEQSNDGNSWIALPVFNAALVTGVPITSAITASASQIIYTFPIRCNFLRLRIATTITGGSIQAFSRLSTEPWTAAVQLVASNTAGNLNATIASPTIAASTNLIGDVGLQVRANATGAASKFHLVSAATTNATNVKNAAGRLLAYRITNTNAAFRYVKLHNSTTAPTAGAGVVETIAVPPNQTITGDIAQGSAFTTGIGITTVTGAADSDATAVGLNDLIIDLYFA